MSGELQRLCLRLAELARKQKAALEARNLDEALELAEARQGVLREIQKFDGPGKLGGADGKPAVPETVLREILAVDREAEDVARSELKDTSMKLGRINTFRVFCQGIADEARLRSAATKP